MPEWWRACADRVTDLMFPPKCILCGERLDLTCVGRTDVFCPQCIGFFSSEMFDRCPECALFWRDCRCVTPLKKRAGCRELIKLFRYRPSRNDLPTNRLILSLKGNATRRALSFPAAFLAEEIVSFLHENQISYADVVLSWVPRAIGAIRRNGYDQSEKLARSVSDAIRRLASGKSLLRVRKTIRRRRFFRGSVQKKLGRREREKNARLAFLPCGNAGRSVSGRVVLLLDDVVTTGASMAACARLLRRAGAKRVVGVCLGMTYERNEKVR